MIAKQNVWYWPWLPTWILEATQIAICYVTYNNFTKLINEIQFFLSKLHLGFFGHTCRYVYSILRALSENFLEYSVKICLKCTSQPDLGFFFRNLVLKNVGYIFRCSNQFSSAKICLGTTLSKFYN